MSVELRPTPIRPSIEAESPGAKANYRAWGVEASDFDSLGDLVRWAVLAPSSHNTQPWIFEVEQDAILVRPDLSRALNASDPTYRQLYLSLGAACANLKIAARYFGLRAIDEMVPGSSPRTPSRRLRFATAGVPSVSDTELFQAIARRSSQRGPHTPRPVPIELREALLDDAQRAGLEMHLVEDRSQLAQMGVLMYAVDRIILSDAGFTGELSEWIRPNSTDASDGMPGSGFSMPDLESKLFPMLVRSGRMASFAAEADRQLFAEQTTCVGVIAADSDDPSSWLAAGELFQMVALRATSLGLGANVLAGMIETRDFHHDLQLLVGAHGRPQLLFRLGYPERVTPRAPRRQAAEVTAIDLGTGPGVLPEDRPTLFCVDAEDSNRMTGPRLNGARVTDRYGEEWLTELCMIRHPAVDFRTPAGLELLRAFVASRNRKSDGAWVYFPWRHHVTHVLARQEFQDLLYSRNYPCIDRQTQAALGRMRVGVAGLSVGSSIARALVMTGVQHLRIADFDTIAPSNNNRLGMGSVLHVGERKATILAHELYEFNPYLDLEVFHAGVTDANMNAFLDGLDVVVDHIDDVARKLKLRDEAARRGVIVLMGTDLGLTPIFDVELPGAGPAFGGRASREALAVLATEPSSFTEWARRAVEVFGLDNTPAAVLDNFLAVRRKEQNYASQLGLTGYAAAAQLAYFVYEIARGNAQRLAPFKQLHLEQVDLFEGDDDARARSEFVREFGL